MRFLVPLCVFSVGCRPAVSVEDSAQIPVDTGEVGVPAALDLGSEVVCQEPGLRAGDGPYRLISGGQDWENQLLQEGDEEMDRGRGLSVADFDGDGFYDIFLPNLGPDQLYMGEADGTWRDDTAERYGLRFHRTQGSVAADVDGDGGIDLVAVNRGNPNRLYLNNGTAHFDVVDESGFADQGAGSIGGSLGDIDGDGDLDLLICAHFKGPTPEWDQENPGPADPSELYENLGNGSFRDRSDLLPQAAHDGYTYACGLHDLDGDGRQDIYLVNDFGTRVVSNRYYRNTTEGSTWNFEDASEDSGLDVELFGMGLGVGDLNGDLLPDLFITSWDALALLESAGDGTWYESSASRGLGVTIGVSDVGWGVELEDLDNDGDLDAYLAYGYLEGDDEPGLLNPAAQKNALFVQGEGGQFDEQAEAWGVADAGVNRGFVLVDLNRDGFLDIVARDLAGPATIRLARCDGSSWVQVSLDQGGLNSSAVGARVEVRTSMGGQVRWVRAGGTNLSSSGPAVVHFGLGQEDDVDQIKVTWPDGEESRFSEVPVNRLVQVRRL